MGSPAFGGEGRHDAFSPARQARFLHHLAGSGTVRSACLAAGVSPQAAYVRRRRSGQFAAAWDAALVLARDHAEAVLAERALEGVEEAVYYHGEEIARRRRYDARLLLAHLARLDRHAEGNAAARARADRFDELVALVAGAAPQGLVAPEPWTREGQEADPFLPPPRAAHVARSTDGLGPRAYRKARLRAGAQWDAWQERAEAMVDGLADGRGDDSREAGPDAAGPTEFKSLAPPPPPRPAIPSRTLSTSSTTPPAPVGNARAGGDPDAGKRPDGRAGKAEGNGAATGASARAALGSVEPPHRGSEAGDEARGHAGALDLRVVALEGHRGGAGEHGAVLEPEVVVADLPGGHDPVLGAALDPDMGHEHAVRRGGGAGEAGEGVAAALIRGGARVEPRACGRGGAGGEGEGFGRRRGGGGGLGPRGAGEGERGGERGGGHRAERDGGAGQPGAPAVGGVAAGRGVVGRGRVERAPGGGRGGQRGCQAGIAHRQSPLRMLRECRAVARGRVPPW